MDLRDFIKQEANKFSMEDWQNRHSTEVETMFKRAGFMSGMMHGINYMQDKTTAERADVMEQMESIVKGIALDEISKAKENRR